MYYFHLLICVATEEMREIKEKLDVCMYTHPHAPLVEHSSTTSFQAGKACFNAIDFLSRGGEGRNSCQLLCPRGCGYLNVLAEKLHQKQEKTTSCQHPKYRVYIHLSS